MNPTDPKHRPDLEAQGWPGDAASADLGRTDRAVDAGGPTAHTRTLSHHELPDLQTALGPDEVDRLIVLAEGTQLDEGATYLDLDDRGAGPFHGLDGRTVVDGERIVAKRDVDHELWNRLVGARR